MPNLVLEMEANLRKADATGKLTPDKVDQYLKDNGFDRQSYRAALLKARGQTETPKPEQAPAPEKPIVSNEPYGTKGINADMRTQEPPSDERT